MIGMNDDTRFLTENRHGHLLAEAETRRLAEDGAERSGNGLGAVVHRLGNRLFGDRSAQAEVAEASTAAGSADTRPIPGLMAAERPTSAADPCTGSRVHGQVAA